MDKSDLVGLTGEYCKVLFEEQASIAVNYLRWVNWYSWFSILFFLWIAEVIVGINMRHILLNEVDVILSKMDSLYICMVQQGYGDYTVDSYETEWTIQKLNLQRMLKKIQIHRYLWWLPFYFGVKRSNTVEAMGEIFFSLQALGGEDTTITEL